MEKPRVLLVDDNEATCTLITALLQRDHEIDIAIDGSEAIEKLKLRSYDVIILDLLMPQVDGFAVLDHLKSAHPDQVAKVIVVTAAVAPSQIEKANSYGIAAVVRKPFEVDVLLRAVTDVVRGPDSNARRLMSGSMIFLLADLLRHRWM